MAKFRLRYQATDLELPKGDFVIGRSRECSLAVDDALVSRRHAVLHVTEEGVLLEDLKSRNGVSVNGEKLLGALSLRHLDRMTVGTQEMIVLEVGRQTDPPEQTLSCNQCGTDLALDDRFCRQCGAPAIGTRAPAMTLEFERYSNDAASLAADDGQDDVTRRAVGLNLVSAIVEKSLALGRYEEAERIVEKHLHNMLQMTMKGAAPPPDMLRRATDYAVALAGGLERGRWIDWIFQVHSAANILLPSSTVDTLHQLVRKIRYHDGRALREYLTHIRSSRDSLSASEKFVLKRLEGLERVITA
ncbi:MAG: FHA domain-containing protein [Myxococcales bacterium]|nr:FHA domain-containing protein [Myxococcales bacterium]